jgi:hypothetical protein
VAIPSINDSTSSINPSLPVSDKELLNAHDLLNESLIKAESLIAVLRHAPFSEFRDETLVWYLIAVLDELHHASDAQEIIERARSENIRRNRVVMKRGGASSRIVRKLKKIFL